jgi:hypothetical protein
MGQQPTQGETTARIMPPARFQRRRRAQGHRHTVAAPAPSQRFSSATAVAAHHQPPFIIMLTRVKWIDNSVLSVMLRPDLFTLVQMRSNHLMEFFE